MQFLLTAVICMLTVAVVPCLNVQSLNWGFRIKTDFLLVLKICMYLCLETVFRDLWKLTWSPRPDQTGLGFFRGGGINRFPHNGFLASVCQSPVLTSVFNNYFDFWYRFYQSCLLASKTVTRQQFCGVSTNSKNILVSSYEAVTKGT